MLARPFGDLSRGLCYVGPLVTRAWLCYVGPLPWLCRPSGDLSHVWLCYVGHLVTLAVFGYVCRPFGDLLGIW